MSTILIPVIRSHVPVSTLIHKKWFQLLYTCFHSVYIISNQFEFMVNKGNHLSRIIPYKEYTSRRVRSARAHFPHIMGTAGCNFAINLPSLKYLSYCNHYSIYSGQPIVVRHNKRNDVNARVAEGMLNRGTIFRWGAIAKVPRV